MPRSARSTARCRRRIRVRTVLNRTQLVDATVRTVATNLLEGASLVILVLLLLLGNFRAALVTALVIPVTMLITAMGMLQVKLSANLMSLGRARLRPDRRRRGDHRGEQPAASWPSASASSVARSAQHERLDAVTESANEVIGPTVYGQLIIALVYVPLLTFSGVEGKTFQPMALTVLIALMTAFVLSLTFMPAMIAILVTGKVNEQDNGFVRGLKALYRPVLSAVIRRPMPAIAAGVLSFACAALLFSRLGQEFIPKLDEKNIVMEVKRIPSTSLTQSQTMQFINERMIGKFPQVAFVFSRGGTPDLAADPMPPSATDTYIILKPRHGMARSGSAQGRADPRHRRAGRENPRQQDRLLAADPDALQRADRGRARGPGGQRVRRRVRADAARRQPDRSGARGHSRHRPKSRSRT